MATSAPIVIAKSGITAMIQSAGPGLFQLVFQRAALKAELPCRGHPPEDDGAAHLLDQAMLELAFFDECDDVLEWAGELELDPAQPETLVEFKAIDVARSNLIALIGQQRYDELKAEIAIGQAIAAAASSYASSQDT